MAETKLNWPKLLDEALTAPGNLGDTYSRFWPYSLTNMMLFRMQGLHEPVASAKRWAALGRHIVDYSKRKDVIVPLIVHEKPKPDETLEEKRERIGRLVGFKVVRGVFGVSATDGHDLPPVPIPGFDFSTMLEKFGIREAPYTSLDGDLQGYSYGLEYAINPVAVNRNKTIFHEIAHIILGHTVMLSEGASVPHRGIREFEAEGTAYLVMNELELMDEDTASVSRGYIRHWLEDDTPDDKSIQRVFRAAEAILKAGRVDTNFDTNAVENTP